MVLHAMGALDGFFLSLFQFLIFLESLLYRSERDYARFGFLQGRESFAVVPTRSQCLGLGKEFACSFFCFLALLEGFNRVFDSLEKLASLLVTRIFRGYALYQNQSFFELSRAQGFSSLTQG